MTVDYALQIIKEIRQWRNSRISVGAGTVLDAETAILAIHAGAEFIVGPITSHDIIKMCRRYSRVVISGAYTPNEVFNSWELGADIIKVFPAGLKGPQHIRDLKGPFPHIELMPTGGVSIENAVDYIREGACAVTIGTDLLGYEWASGDFDPIIERSTTLMKMIRNEKFPKHSLEH